MALFSFFKMHWPEVASYLAPSKPSSFYRGRLPRATRENLFVRLRLRATALSFPDQIDKVLTLVADTKSAKQCLDAVVLLAHYARRVKADTEIMNAIQYGKIKIGGKIGELSPAAKPEETGRARKKLLHPVE
jgi:hypothetical protein